MTCCVCLFFGVVCVVDVVTGGGGIIGVIVAVVGLRAVAAVVAIMDVRGKYCCSCLVLFVVGRIFFVPRCIVKFCWVSFRKVRI